MIYSFIFNTGAGPKPGPRRIQELHSLLEEYGMQGELVEASSGEAIERASRDLAERSDVVVAAGGDGTVQAVAQGVFSGGRQAVLGVLPMGTGNDFERALRLPLDLPAAFSVLKSGSIRHVDIGVLTWSEAMATNRQVFVNAIGIGVEAAIAEKVQQRKSGRGWIAYAKELLQVLQTWRLPTARIEGGAHVEMLEEVLAGEILACTIGNGPTSGGGFRLTPGASVSDGALNCMAVPQLTKWRLARILPWVPLGLHGAFPEVVMHAAPVYRITSDRPLLAHADGEIITRTATQISVEVVRKALPIMATK